MAKGKGQVARVGGVDIAAPVGERKVSCYGTFVYLPPSPKVDWGGAKWPSAEDKKAADKAAKEKAAKEKAEADKKAKEEAAAKDKIRRAEIGFDKIQPGKAPKAQSAFDLWRAGSFSG